MKEYRITFYDIKEAAQFVEYLEKSDLNGTLRYKGKVSDARSFMGILSFGFIGKPLVLAMADGKKLPADKLHARVQDQLC